MGNRELTKIRMLVSSRLFLSEFFCFEPNWSFFNLNSGIFVSDFIPEPFNALPANNVIEQYVERDRAVLARFPPTGSPPLDCQ